MVGIFHNKGFARSNSKLYHCAQKHFRMGFWKAHVLVRKEKLDVLGKTLVQKHEPRCFFNGIRAHGYRIAFFAQVFENAFHPFVMLELCFDDVPCLILFFLPKGLPKDKHDAIWQEKQNQTRNIIKTEFKHDERMKGILERLRKEGYAIAVCSNSIKETAGLMLLHKGLFEYIEFFLSNEDVRFPKPHPEMFLRAMVELGVAPRETLIVEDSHHGREAAHASGAHVLGVTNTSDVTYEKIAKAIESAHGKRETAKFVPKWQGGELRVVIPMAGAGKKFLEAGFSFPKPLIDIKGKPMIQWVVENVNVDAKFVFIVLKEHLEKYNLNYLLKLIAPGCEIVALEEPTQGAALSVLAASHLFDHEHPLAIVNSDPVIDWNSNEFFYAMAADECAGGIVNFESTHPKWSFVKTGDDGFVTEVAEKKPIR